MPTSSAPHNFAGVFALLLTPFNDRRAIDWSTYATYVDWQLERRPHGLFAVCGSSEMMWLTLDERLRLARETVRRAHDTPVVATANLDPDLEKHQEELQRVVDTGVSGVVLVPPSGLGREPQRLQEHFAALADAAPCPVFLYEWPQVDHYHIPAGMYGELARAHGVRGIKDTTRTPAGIEAKIHAAPDSIVYQANTPHLPEAIHAGARGIMAITSSACADLVVTYWERASRSTSQNGEDAETLHSRLVFLDAVLRFDYPALAKHLLRLRGLDFPTYCRWPVTATAEGIQALKVWHTAVSRDA